MWVGCFSADNVLWKMKLLYCLRGKEWYWWRRRIKEVAREDSVSDAAYAQDSSSYIALQRTTHCSGQLSYKLDTEVKDKMENNNNKKNAKTNHIKL